MLSSSHLGLLSTTLVVAVVVDRIVVGLAGRLGIALGIVAALVGPLKAVLAPIVELEDIVELAPLPSPEDRLVLPTEIVPEGNAALTYAGLATCLDPYLAFSLDQAVALGIVALQEDKDPAVVEPVEPLLVQELEPPAYPDASPSYHQDELAASHQ
jgi:hypothetical protein